MHKRMGEEVRSDFAISVDVIHKILGYLNRKYGQATTVERRREVVKIALFFFVLTFCIALRGEEVVKMDVTGFCSILNQVAITKQSLMLWSL